MVFKVEGNNKLPITQWYVADGDLHWNLGFRDFHLDNAVAIFAVVFGHALRQVGQLNWKYNFGAQVNYSSRDNFYFAGHVFALAGLILRVGLTHPSWLDCTVLSAAVVGIAIAVIAAQICIHPVPANLITHYVSSTTDFYFLLFESYLAFLAYEDFLALSTVIGALVTNSARFEKAW